VVALRRSASRGRARVLASAWLLAANAWAAGGHHAVDDAALLPPGACEQESWFTRVQGGGQLLHAGAGCRVGPVELAAAAEHARGAGPGETAWNLEAKWAHELVEGFSVGLDLQPVWQAHQRPRRAATQFAALASWTPRPDLALHLNLGREFVRRGADLPRHGIAAEWSPRPRWSLVGERYLEQRTQFARAGLRWAAGPSWSVDLSHAVRLSGPAPSTWTVGLSFSLGGD
jgi:hypothetical protein